jgi:hypothetical protein
MSAVCVLTPIVIGSWPMIATAVGGVAASLGFSIASGVGNESGTQAHNKVESALPNSEVIEESMSRGQSVIIEKDGVTVRIGQDERGRCTVCVSSDNLSKAEMKAVGDEVSGRLIQQFTYHKLVTELKQRRFEIVDEQMTADESIKLRVRVGGGPG